MDYASIVVSIGKLAVFAIFITAIIEVIKSVAAKGLWNLLKELVISLVKNSPLSPESVKVLNFVISLIYCKIFSYGVMQEVLQLEFVIDGQTNTFAYFLDYIGTSSVIYMGADWFYDKIKEIKTKYGQTTT